jgi:hypothetical protein
VVGASELHSGASFFQQVANRHDGSSANEFSAENLLLSRAIDLPPNSNWLDD